MNKAQALDIAITAMFREILREDEPNGYIPREVIPKDGPEPGIPKPLFDFVDDDFCEHNGHLVPKATCPVHGPESETVPTAEELDDMTSETFEEENPMIARARRLAEQKLRQQSQERVYAEELPMGGAGPPPDVPPNLVV